ncbi:MAG: hypothetical protein NTW48_00585 [Chloroflexi bacterium]|nr:hypothetical protein [Chloroflexota bacterium]
MARNEELCQLIVSDLRVEPHPDPFSNPDDRWPLVRYLPPRLGGVSYGRGINIPTVWADCDGQAISDMLNVLGQAGKTNNITITKFSEDEGNRNCHLVVIGGQDLNAQDFYAQMEGVYYRMDTQEIYDVQNGRKINREPGYGYGLILKARNPFVVGSKEGVGLLLGGFGVLGTMAAAHYLRTHVQGLGAQFGKKNFSIVVRAPISTGYQGVERIVELDRPFLSRWDHLIARIRHMMFRA